MLKQINHARRNACFNLAEMKRRGYRQIGRGAFSTVFYHPDAPDVAVKVGKPTCRRLPHYRDVFPEYAERILSGDIRSKFYPRIYEVRRDPDGPRTLTIMKRYKKIRSDNVSETISSTFHQLRRSRTWSSSTPDRRFKRALEPLLGYEPDIHSNNVMQDKNGTPILTDPVLQLVLTS